MSAVAEDKRSELLTSALRLFAAHGYDGVGVQQIVEAAGVTKPTLYHYFGNKRGLLEALLDERMGEVHAALARAAEYRRDLPATLTEIARVLFGFARARPDLFRLHLSLWFAPVRSEAHEVAARFHQRDFAVVEKLFREAVRDHGNMNGRHRAYAATFLGMIHHYVALGLNDYAVLDDALTRQSVHQFMHGIFS